VRRLGSATLIAGMLQVIAAVSPCRAAVCTVPSASHPTIQEAVDDLACTEIALAAGTFVEAVGIDRDLELHGASSATTVIEGRVVIDGAATEVELRDLTIDTSATAACFPEALLSRGGARLGANNLAVVNDDGDACLIFGDGFEAGNTSAWSVTVP